MVREELRLKYDLAEEPLPDILAALCCLCSGEWTCEVSMHHLSGTAEV